MHGSQDLVDGRAQALVDDGQDLVDGRTQALLDDGEALADVVLSDREGVHDEHGRSASATMPHVATCI